MINVLVALVGTFIAAIYDIRTGYVPDLLSHVMIILGAAFVVLALPFQQALFTFGFAALVFAIGFITYITGQMGGGDVKLFTALALLLPYYPQEAATFSLSLGINPAIPSYPFLISIFILSGILFMFIIPVLFLRKISQNRKKVQHYGEKLQKGAMFALLMAPLILVYIFIAPPFLILAFPLIATAFLLPFKDDAVRLFFAMKKRVSSLNSEDVIALELLSKNIKEKLGLKRKTYTERELKRIKALARKHNITTITVCENMPKFVPYMFAALVISLILGDFLLFLMFSI